MSSSSPTGVSALRAVERARAAWRRDGQVDGYPGADEHSRLAVAARLHALVETVAAALQAGEAEAAANDGGSIADTLILAGLLRDPVLRDEMTAQVAFSRMADALPSESYGSSPVSLLVRLAGRSDGVVARLARALLAADSCDPPSLAEPLQRRLIWWIAAALEPAVAPGEPLATAARRLATQLPEPSVEAAATRLVEAMDVAPADLPALLLEALGDRRLSLFVALLARGARLDFDQARSIVLDPDDARLGLALRAAGVRREDIARVALALVLADPRRDIEAFADRLDALAALDADAAREQLAAAFLERDFRIARAAMPDARP